MILHNMQIMMKNPYYRAANGIIAGVRLNKNNTYNAATETSVDEANTHEEAIVSLPNLEPDINDTLEQQRAMLERIFQAKQSESEPIEAMVDAAANVGEDAFWGLLKMLGLQQQEPDTNGNASLDALMMLAQSNSR